MDGYKIRKGTSSDAPVLLEMIECLTSHLNSGPIKYDVHYLIKSLEQGDCHALLAEGSNHYPVGYILYFYGFSSPNGKFIFMEDYFVRPEFRNQGIGTALWSCLAKIAVEENHEKMEWQVYGWNEEAIKLYKKLGGIDVQEESDDRNYKLNKDDIFKLAALHKDN